MNEKKMSYPKMAIFGLQHMFAMFGATILVPMLTGLSVQVTLIAVGIGTLIFHFISKGKIPAFLGSSFAFMVGINLIADEYTGIFAGGDLTQQERLAYATGAILVSGLVYLFFALLIKLVGVKRFMKFVPPVVTAPTVILIGIMLAPWAIRQSNNNWILAIITLGIVIVASSWGKGMIKIIPILLGIMGAYLVALVIHFTGLADNVAFFANTDGTAILDFSRASDASIVGLPPFMAPRFNVVSILIMIPFALATIAEHIGDIVALGTITGKNFVDDPGLSRTLLGDGIASMFSGAIGGPASTTYGENVGVVALTRIFNPRVVQIGAIFATILAFSPLFASVIYSIPEAIIGGASFMLYGMIAAVGIRNLVESRVDISKTKNLTIIAVILVTGLGLRFGPAITFTIGTTNVPMDRLGIAIAVVLGVVLNIILPDQEPEQ